nr:immunoglobulin light chain junction region [Macaca mulatta]
CMEALDFPYSF